MTGVQFENKPTNEYSCFGDHLDEQYYYLDLMSAFASKFTMDVSPLNIAFFEDSHHYVGNYSKSYVNAWGHGATCEFLESTCDVIQAKEDAGELAS